MNWDLNYGELVNDENLVNNYENLKVNLIEVQNVVDECLQLKERYDDLPRPAQIELDLFLVYTLNALQWIRLRIQGVDPTQHPVKDELMRVRTVMKRWQEVKDRDKRPKLDKDAAKRFIKHGLYDPETGQAVNKKIKFEDTD